jgi:hypothetical protein
LICEDGSATRRRRRQGEDSPLTGTYREPISLDRVSTRLRRTQANAANYCRSACFALYSPVFGSAIAEYQSLIPDPFPPRAPGQGCALRCLLQKCRCSPAVISLILPLLSRCNCAVVNPRNGRFPRFFKSIEVRVEIWSRRISDPAVARMSPRRRRGRGGVSVHPQCTLR